MRGPQLVVIDGSVVAMRFVITGEPVAKGRPRTRVIEREGGKSYAQIYTDPQTRSWEETVGEQVRAQLLGWSVDPSIPGQVALPLEKRIVVGMRFNFTRPKSLPKREEYPLTKKDVDNLAKSVLDALQTVEVIRDDNKVTDLTVCKRFADEDHLEGVEVDVTGWLS